MDLRFQRTQGGVIACESDLNGFAMTLCMFIADAKDYLIKNQWREIRKLSFQTGQSFSPVNSLSVPVRNNDMEGPP